MSKGSSDQMAARAAAREILAAKTVLVLAHIRSDGDSVGSALALVSLLVFPELTDHIRRPPVRDSTGSSSGTCSWRDSPVFLT